ncbi:substrate-binding domain-containing protein [soil metagenome]
MMTLRLIVVFAVLACFSCKEKDKHGNIVDTATSGTIKIAVDESLRPLIEAEVMAFEGIYQQAHLDVVYTSETKAIEDLMNDSVRLAIVTRQLTAGEREPFARAKITPTESNIGMGAVAIILNKTSKDTVIRVTQLKDILTGKITNWGQINGSKDDTPIEVIFDNPASGIARFLRDSLANGQALPSNCFAVNGNQAVIDYISKKTNAIGFIGSEWISDSSDSQANKFLKTIRVAGLASDSSYFLPYQAYIALRQYPLCRSQWILSREARAGLGTGFTSFVAGEKGQRILLKAGLVPKTMPIRIVEINRTNN